MLRLVSVHIMRIFVIVSIIAIGVLDTSYAQDAGVSQPELRDELLDRVKKDQAIRKALLDRWMVEPDQELLSEMRAIDSSNTARMREIVDRYGWPGRDLVGAEGSNAAFLIVQHADAEFQKLVLPMVKRAYEAGDLKGQSYALLLDRVLVQDGHKQIFGTQIKPMHLWEDGPEPYPIRDRDEVDARRADVGLPPLEAYMDVIKKMYDGSDQGGEG